VCGAALWLSGCAAGEVPTPAGKSALDYALALVKLYGWIAIPLALIGFFIYALTNKLIEKLVEWLVGRITKLLDKAANARETESSRQRDDAAALRGYLEHILSHHQTLNLRGIRSSRPLNLGLEELYIPLTTMGRHSEGRGETESEHGLPVRGRPLVISLPDLLARHTRLVILGDPGAGKTTFLSYLALTYARQRDGRWPNLMRERLGFNDNLLPVFLPLRDFARHIRVRCESGPVEAGPAVLLDFIVQHFAQWSLGLSAAFFTDPLEAGGCLVLLDGLDEVADFEERVLVREIVEAFVRRYPKNRYVLTCRLGGYRDAARLGSGFYECRVREFDGEEVACLARIWCLAVETAQAGALNLAVRHRAERQAIELLNAIERNPRVRALANNPLMLTVIALVHRYRATLPQRRIELYEECTELLLGHWDMGKEGEEAKWLAEYAGLEMPLEASEKRALLEPVARWYHEQRVTEAEADRVERLLAGRLTQSGEGGARQGPARARAFLRFLKERSGLFLEWEVGRYAFSHLTFQEYLTARDIAGEDGFAAFLLERLDDSWWREVILLSAAHLSLTSRARASQLVAAILAAGARYKAVWWKPVILAGECLIDIGPVRLDAKTWQDVLRGLTWIAERQTVPLNDRLRAVTVLGELGDPRLGATVSVPAGERPAQPGFEMDQLPVANAQFAQFIQAGGYRTRDYWSAAGWTFIQEERIERPRFWDDPLWNRPNYPVVGVSWYEAEAYARWAGGALPNEAQWERAAGRDAATRQTRQWPWGDEPAGERANTSDLHLDGTTPVGLFPQGASPCGALDMAGNVWEWCANPYGDAGNGGKDAQPLIALRGGSWRDELTLAGVGARDRARPTTREADIGFRLVWNE
jgi:hypothetical protein